jgi:hypothetical protein
VPDSLKWMLLKTETSNCLVPGPNRILRPEFPKVYAGGCTKSAMLNHSVGEEFARWPEPIRLGYCTPVPLLRFEVAMVGVNGDLVWKVSMLLICQPAN